MVDDASKWLVEQLKNLGKPQRYFNKNAVPTVGRMFLYTYIAKHKDTLPYYDMYPLVIPIEFYGDGFLGINFHYLPPMARAALLNSLTVLADNDKYNDNTKLTISYQILRSYSSKLASYENCLKRYLFNCVASSFQEIDSKDWNKVVLLPLQRWKVNPNRKYSAPLPY